MQFSFFFDSVEFVSKHVGIYVLQLLQFLTIVRLYRFIKNILSIVDRILKKGFYYTTDILIFVSCTCVS